MKKEDLPGWEQLNLYDNLVEYKGSFLNCVLLNQAFPHQTALTWRDWTERDSSNRLYLTYLYLNDPRHLRAMLRIALDKHKEKLQFPLFIFCYRYSVEGNRAAWKAGYTISKDTLWGCKKLSRKELFTLCGYRNGP